MQAVNPLAGYVVPQESGELSGRQTAQQDCLSSHHNNNYNGTDSNYCASEQSNLTRQPQDRSILSQHSAYSRQGQSPR